METNVHQRIYSQPTLFVVTLSNRMIHLDKL